MAKYIKNFFEDRFFRVAIGGILSEKRALENGVPQGSVISVTLFLVAMQSIFKVIPKDIHILVYADDILIVAVGLKPQLLRARLQRTANKVLQWSKEIGFSISPNKSKVLHICNNLKHNRVPTLTLDGRVVEQVRQAKVLGVYIDKNLSFTYHVKMLKEAMKGSLQLIKRIGGYFNRGNRNTLLKVINAIIMPKLLYGIQLYGRASLTTLRRLEPIYNQAIRMASGAFRTSPVVSLLAESGQMPFMLRITKSIVTKAVSWMENENDPFPDNNVVVTRAKNWLRNATGLELPEVAGRPNTRLRRWSDRGPKIDWTIKRDVRAGDNSLKVKAYFNKLIENKYSQHHIVYTDGSVAENSTGYGVTDTIREKKGRLAEQCSIFSAEAMAILTAIREYGSVENNTVIFSDSASCLQALEKGCSTHPWVKAIESANRTKPTILSWIPGHAGITGNEQADILANIARTAVQDNTSVPAADIKRWLTRVLRATWNQAWKTEQRPLLRGVKDDTDLWTDSQTRGDQKVLTRWRIGHTHLTHQHLLDRTGTPMCTVCGTVMTVHHILVECTQYDVARVLNDLESSVQLILQNKRMEEKKLVMFLRDIGIYNKI